MAAENKENPIQGIIDTIRKIAKNNNSPVMQIGKILASPPEIQVAYNGITLDKDEIYISEYLLMGYRRTAKGHIVSGTQTACSTCGHAHVIDNDYTDDIIYTDTLVAGDLVSIMPILAEDGTKQKYIILDRIVELWKR